MCQRTCFQVKIHLFVQADDSGLLTTPEVTPAVPGVRKLFNSHEFFFLPIFIFNIVYSHVTSFQAAVRNDSEMDETVDLNSNFQEFDDESSSSESSSFSESSSSSEDDISKLTATVTELKREVSTLKNSLSDCKRNLTLANNLRIAHKEEVQSLKVSLEESKEELKSLSKRNETLQDLLCQKYSGIYGLCVKLCVFY